MSYQDAIKAFGENMKLARNPGADAPSRDLTVFNMDEGLALLADAISLDLAAIRQQVQALRGEIAALRER